MSEDLQKGRHGKSNHQHLIKLASRKLLEEILGDDYIAVTLVREQPMDISAGVSVHGVGRLADVRITDTKQRMYADIACSAVFDQGAKSYLGKEPIMPGSMEIANKFKEEGDMERYREYVRIAYGVMTYIIECETTRVSNLLTDGPRLTAYKLIKQKVPNFMLILAIFEGTVVDHPEVFDEVWRFPKE